MRQSHNGSTQHFAFQSLISVTLIYLLKFATSTEITIQRTHWGDRKYRSRWCPRLHDIRMRQIRIHSLPVTIVHCLNSVLILFDKGQQYHCISETCTLSKIYLSHPASPPRISPAVSPFLEVMYASPWDTYVHENTQFDLQSAGCIQIQREMLQIPQKEVPKLIKESLEQTV